MKRLSRTRPTEQTDLQAKAAERLAKLRGGTAPKVGLGHNEYHDDGGVTTHATKPRQEVMYIRVNSYGRTPIWFDAYAIIREQLKLAQEELNKKIGDGTRIYIELVYHPGADLSGTKSERV